ncbi:MAG: peptidoglycan DD-metalloendopeptidase family protein [Candidatus Omnitrophica bacterium]|nr:peptidoglycan DD-metalloendopeptidase family protein [Candidatus Omnitrophota bacterium]
MKFVTVFILLFMLSCAPARTPYRSQPVDIPPAQGTEYLVRKGDSLWRISRRYGVSVEKLMDLNNLASPRMLKTGQKLVIPEQHTPHTRGTDQFIWPVQGQIVRSFGEEVDNLKNKGINIKSSSSMVYSSGDGTVVFADYLRGWGNTLIVSHPSDIYTIYANLNQTTVTPGTSVSKGKKIGTLQTDREGNYILHFEIRKKHSPQDPLKFLVKTK